MTWGQLQVLNRIHRWINAGTMQRCDPRGYSGHRVVPALQGRCPPAAPLMSAALLHAQEVQLKVGFQGLDIYSLAASSDSVVKFLEEMDPAAAQRARGRYGCFDKWDAVR